MLQIISWIFKHFFLHSITLHCYLSLSNKAMPFGQLNPWVWCHCFKILNHQKNNGTDLKGIVIFLAQCVEQSALEIEKHCHKRKTVMHKNKELWKLSRHRKSSTLCFVTLIFVPTEAWYVRIIIMQGTKFYYLLSLNLIF